MVPSYKSCLAYFLALELIKCFSSPMTKYIKFLWSCYLMCHISWTTIFHLKHLWNWDVYLTSSYNSKKASCGQNQAWCYNNVMMLDDVRYAQTSVVLCFWRHWTYVSLLEVAIRRLETVDHLLQGLHGCMGETDKGSVILGLWYSVMSTVLEQWLMGFRGPRILKRFSEEMVFELYH